MSLQYSQGLDTNMIQQMKDIEALKSCDDVVDIVYERR